MSCLFFCFSLSDYFMFLFDNLCLLFSCSNVNVTYKQGYLIIRVQALPKHGCKSFRKRLEQGYGTYISIERNLQNPNQQNAKNRYAENQSPYTLFKQHLLSAATLQFPYPARPATGSKDQRPDACRHGSQHRLRIRCGRTEQYRHLGFGAVNIYGNKAKMIVFCPNTAIGLTDAP